MTELSPRARALFEAGRRSLQPADADRERIFSALSTRVGGPEPDGGKTPGTPAAAGGLSWPAITAITALMFGLGIVGAGGYELLRSEAHPMPVPASSSAPVASVVSVAPPSPEPPPIPAPVPSEASAPADTGGTPRPSVRSDSAPTPPSDRLAEEVAILSEAERAIHAEQYQLALQLLDEHRRKFPHGALAQERMAARVQALCGLGRVSDAQAALARLTRLSPNSPHEDRAREACAAKN